MASASLTGFNPGLCAALSNHRRGARLLRRLLLPLLFTATAPALAGVDEQQQEYFALITQYVNKIANIYDGTWAYTYTVDDRLEQESSTRRVDPTLELFQSDVLLDVNGQPPSLERVAEHQRMLEKRHKRRLRNAARSERSDPDGGRRSRVDGSEQERFLAMLIPESIELLKQEGELLYLRFKALEEDRRHIFEHTYGILVLDTQQQYIRELQVHLTEPFAPYLLTKVEDGYFSLRFALVDGKPMQQALSWRVQGQAVVVWDLDADREVVWRDLQKVAVDNS